MTEICERVGGAAATLVCGPACEGEGRAACRTLLAAGVEDGREPVIISYDRSAEDCVAALSETDLESVRPGVVLVGDRSGSRDGDQGLSSLQTVATPGDLTALGITLTRHVAETDGRVTVCFDSVSALLDHVPAETVYEFLHTVTSQLYDADARAHFHVDPDAHDETTVAAFASLCDAVVSFDDGPSARVRPSAE